MPLKPASALAGVVSKLTARVQRQTEGRRQRSRQPLRPLGASAANPHSSRRKPKLCQHDERKQGEKIVRLDHGKPILKIL